MLLVKNAFDVVPDEIRRDPVPTLWIMFSAMFDVFMQSFGSHRLSGRSMLLVIVVLSRSPSGIVAVQRKI